MTKVLHFDERNEREFCYEAVDKSPATNARKRRKMARLAASVMGSELTELQRYCVTEHYLNGKKQKEIAERLGLSRSTVSRHISAGIRNLQKAAKYIN